MSPKTMTRAVLASALFGSVALSGTAFAQCAGFMGMADAKQSVPPVAAETPRVLPAPEGVAVAEGAPVRIVTPADEG